MCQKRSLDEYYRGVESLVDELPQSMAALVLGGTSHTTEVEPGTPVGGAWVGGFAYYSLLANL